MKPLKYGLFFILSLYLVLVLGMYTFQRTLIYHPSPGPVHLTDWQAEDMQAVILTTSDHLNLNSWYKPSTSPDLPTLLHFHGNSGHIGNRVYKMRPYLDKGWGVLLVEYRGFGGNPGHPTEQGLYKDAEGALAFLESQKINPNKIIVYGESLGTGVAVYLASQMSQNDHPPRAVVLEAPYSSIPEVGAGRYPFIPVDWLTVDRFDSFSRIINVDAPLLIAHGTNDQVIPFNLAEKLYEAAPQPKKFLKIDKAGHNNLYDFGMAENVLNFIHSQIRRKHL